MSALALCVLNFVILLSVSKYKRKRAKWLEKYVFWSVEEQDIPESLFWRANIFKNLGLAV